MQEHNFDLRPPLPPRDYPYPLRGRSHASYDGDGISAGGKGQGSASSPLQEDDGADDFASLPPKARLILRSMLCRMYASAEVMQLGSEARFTSLVLFHRYYLASNVIGTLSRKEATATDQKDGSSTHVAVSEQWREHLGTVAASCLFLGCKVEEEHRRIRDVINLSHMFDFAGARGDTGIDKSATPNGESVNDDQHPSATANDVTIHIHEANSPPDLDDDYWKAKERIVATEQEVLRMLHFDVSVGHPHRAVLLILDGLGIDVTTNEGRALANKSFVALNDALFYPPALRHGVLPMACGAIRLVAENGETKDDSKSSGGGGVGAPIAADVSSSSAFLSPGAWWRRFDVADADIELVIKSLERARTSIRSI